MHRSINVRVARSSQEMAQIAGIFFEKDNPYVPVTSLSRLGASPDFIVACLDPSEDIRACSSYKHWLTGCVAQIPDRSTDVEVYELASTLVRDPLGGFAFPKGTMQQVLTFARIMEIMGTSFQSSAGQSFCLIACVIASNTKSYDGLTALGMVPIPTLPRWLEYEHRTWFPKLSERARTLPDEAHYLWLPPDAAKDFVEKMAPLADGKATIDRPRRGDPSATEAFRIVFDIPAISMLARTYGSVTEAAKYFDYSALRAPPPYVRIGNGYF